MYSRLVFFAKLVYIKLVYILYISCIYNVAYFAISKHSLHIQEYMLNFGANTGFQFLKLLLDHSLLSIGAACRYVDLLTRMLPVADVLGVAARLHNPHRQQHAVHRHARAYQGHIVAITRRGFPSYESFQSFHQHQHQLSCQSTTAGFPCLLHLRITGLLFILRLLLVASMMAYTAYPS